MAVEYVLKMPSIRNRDLQNIMGHLTFLALISRNSLAVFDTNYKQAHQSGLNEKIVFTRAVKAELQCFKDLIPLLRNNLAAP